MCRKKEKINEETYEEENEIMCRKLEEMRRA